MRTEEYIIILVGVVAGSDQIKITYTSNAPETNTSVRVVYSNGKTIKTFDHVKAANQGIITLPAQDLMPGSYTCEIALDGNIRDSRKFVIG